MKFNKIIQGHAIEVLKTFPDEVVDCCITSPPYYNLRSYGTTPIIWDGNSNCNHDWGEEIRTGQTSAQTKYQAAKEAFTQTAVAFCSKCGAVRCELGAEPDPNLFVSHLCDIFNEVKRVLKPTGACWVVISDTYGGSGGAGGDYNKGGIREGQPKYKGNNYQAKSLVGIPERFVLEMQERGWIRRNTVIFHKPNVLPQSMNSRFTVDFEYFYFFVKNKNYYFKQMFEPYTAPINRWGGEKMLATGESLWDEGTGQLTYRDRNLRPNPEGRNMRCVWKVNTEASRGIKHYATFPKRLIQTPIEATCPPGGVILDPFCGCYDIKTEVLTRNGWKFFKNVCYEDEFLTRTQECLLEYHKSTVIQKYEYKGQMIRIKSRSTDLFVTPNHNMYVLTHADFQANRGPRFVRADSLNYNLYRIPCGGVYVPEKETFSKEMMYLFGLYVSEGYIEKHRGKISRHVLICQNQGKKWDQMMEWLKPLNPYKRSDRRIGVKLSKETIDFIINNCGQGAHHKFLSSEILSNSHLDCLYKGMMLGDGSVSVYRNETTNKEYFYDCYYTTSDKLRNSFQELCIKLNFETHSSSRKKTSVIEGRPITNVVDCHGINVRKSRNKGVIPNKHVKKENYDGFVYCVTVPNHTLYIRRNGTTSWCGNSGTTCRVAYDMGRNYIGIELNPEFVEISEKRLDQTNFLGMIEKDK